MQLFGNNNRDNGWKQLEQNGIAIPRKWVEHEKSNDDDDDDVCLFVGQDVTPDGNCLLRCLAQSGLVPYDYQEIRQVLYHTSQESALEFGKLAFERCFDNRSYNDYCETSLRKDGEWTGDFEMLLFLKTFGINIISFTSSPFGLLCFNANDYVQDVMHLPSLQQQSGNNNVHTIYLFHHSFGDPLSQGDGDHFALLLRAKDNIHPITGEELDPSKAFHPPLHQQQVLPHDTSKFVGKGTSPSDPLEEVDDNENKAVENVDDVDMVSSDDDGEPVVVLKRKAPEYEDKPSRYTSAKRLTPPYLPRELAFRSPLLFQEPSLLRESPFCRDPWFHKSFFQDSFQRRRVPYGYSVYDDFFF